MNTRTSRLGWRALALLALSLAASSAFAAGKQLWSAKLPGDAKWHTLTGLGTLVVGTSDSVVAFDPDTGQQLWQRNEFKKSSPHNVREVPGTPFLMCNSAGGIGGLTKATFYQIDYLTGQTVWQTPEMQGQYLGTIPVVEKRLVILLVNGANDAGKEHGTYLHAHDLTTGAKKWSTKFAKTGAITLHPADNSGKFMVTTDLSGYHDPVVEGDDIYLPYLGCHRVDLNTGAVKWAAEFEPGNKGIKKTYAPLRMHGDRVYGAGGGSVIAIDKNTGAIAWKSDRISSYAGLLKARNNALVSQIEIVDDKLFARYGGNFSNGQQVFLMEPLGVIALNLADGSELYHFEKAKEGITNLMVLPEHKTVLFADAANLYGIDISGGQPKEGFTVPIEFKRKMGGRDIAQIGLGALGGLRGLAKATMAQNKSRLDVPVAIMRRGDRILVQGKQHLLCFDPAASNIAWATYCPAPSDNFAMAAMFAVTATSALYGNALGMQSGVGTASYDSAVQLTHSSLDAYHKQAGKRRSATKASSNYSFMLTTIEDGRKKGIGLLGINLENGEGDKQFLLDAKEPDYRVDEGIGRLFFFKGRNSLVAYEL